MTKEELKQKAEVCMHNALFWLKLPISKENVEKGSSYILELLEPRENRIVKLEKACHKWFMRWREAKKDALYFDSSLKKQIEATYKVVEKLNKAKDIIRDFVKWANWQGNSKCPSFKKIKDKAEQFLKED